MTIICQQRLHVDGFVGRNTVEAVAGRDDITGFAVLENQFDAICGIIRITGDIGCSSLQYSEERENQPAGTRQQQSHTVALLDTTLMQGGSDAIGDFIHLLIGILRIYGHQSLMVGLCLGEMTDTLMEELEGSLTGCRLTQMRQFILLVLTDDGELTDLAFWLSYHPLYDSYDTFCE